MTNKELKNKIAEQIISIDEQIDEIEFMVGSDYSRHSYNLSHLKHLKSLFEECMIVLPEDQGTNNENR